MNLHRFGFALIAIIPFISSSAHAQSQSCACAYFPVYPMSGDIWVYYGEQFDVPGPPGPEQCSEVTARQCPVVCDINLCNNGNQECSGFPCGTCMPLGGRIKCADLEQMNFGLDLIGPAAGDIRRDLPTEMPDLSTGGKRPHREAFAAPNPRVIKIKTRTGVFYAKIAVLSHPLAKRKFGYGIEVEEPLLPPAAFTPARLPTAPCSDGQANVFRVVQGLVVASVGGQEYMIRVAKSRTPDSIIPTTTIFNGVPFAQPGYAQPASVPCCGDQAGSGGPATPPSTPPLTDAEPNAAKPQLRKSIADLSRRLGELQSALEQVRSELSNLTKALE